jgi:DNA polymerase III subunit chi
MADIWFYHLERESVDKVLPGLLERGLERDLRMAVQTLDGARVQEISQSLWAYEDVAFIPHGIPGEPDPEEQPIFVTSTAENPNAATFRFFIDGAAPVSIEGLARACILFNGNDETALQQARELWKRFKAEGHAIVYQKRDETGRWVDQAAAKREQG